MPKSKGTKQIAVNRKALHDYLVLDRYEAGKTALDEGEKYLIIPSYSPENAPLGYNSPVTANATMDIAAAKDGLRMTVALEQAVRKASERSRILIRIIL